MAIELVEITTGTYGPSTSDPDKTLHQHQAVWDEGSSFVNQIGKILLMSGIFDEEHIEYEKPDYPTAETPAPSGWNDGKKYIVWGLVGDGEEKARVVGIALNSFTTTSPGASSTTMCRGKGIYVYINYQNGEQDEGYAIDKGFSGTYSGKGTADMAYVTSNGILIRSVLDRSQNKDSAEVTKNGVVMIAKSNGEYPIVCASGGRRRGDSSAAASYTDNGPMAHNACMIGCYSDNAVIYTTPPGSTVGPTTNTKDYFRFATSAKQSVLAPFAAYGKANGFTFSPYAFWIPVASDVIRTGGWKKVHIDGKNYATDGYWALRDG